MTAGSSSSRPTRKTQREKLNVLSLFSGIGGLELGLERAGMTTVVAYGVPRRLVYDELHALGNAVAPQVAEYVGRLIVAHLEEVAA